MNIFCFSRLPVACARPVILCLLFVAGSGVAATFTVTTMNDSGPGSLRQALLNANTNPNTDTIRFNISTATKTIALLTPLPDITSPVIIDGTTQPGYAGNPLIELTGTNLSTVLGGLVITAGNSTVRALAINGFNGTGSGYDGAGIALTNGGGNVVEGCYLGTDLTGALSRSNYSGVLISGSASNRVGGTTAAARNLLSGNAGYGLVILNAHSDGNVAEGNFIGTDVTGTNALPNQVGVIIGDSFGNRIGGTAAGARNIISANTLFGVIILQVDPAITPTNNVVEGNFIGTDVTGARALGNGAIPGGDIAGGIYILDSSNNRIGGTSPGAGNVISGNNLLGIGIFHAHNNVIQGNFVGTDASGSAILSNSFVGIILSDGTNNVFGGTSSGARNVVSGNGTIGIVLNGQCTNTLIQGNYIGTDSSGNIALRNGILPEDATGGVLGGIACLRSESTTIGGTAPGAGNLIAGNYFCGITLEGQRHTIQGNLIGVNAAGTSALPNTGFGIVMAGVSDTLVGGTNEAARNIISGNDAVGVYFGDQGSNVVVQGNFIGTDITGSQAIGNGSIPYLDLSGGLRIVNISSNANHVIGGSTTGAGNLISGNFSGGVIVSNYFLFGSGVSIEGNLIGTDLLGTNALGNAGAGVFVMDAFDVTIGGTNDGGANTIAFNQTAGVVIAGDLSFHDSIRQNRIFGNGGLGIDLGNDGVTANDAGDGDGGANTSQNFPVLNLGFRSGTNTTVAGTLNSVANSSFTIEFFASEQCDPSGHGEGATFLGASTVTTMGGGNANFLVVFTNVVLTNQFVTATATSAAGDTSEFSPCVQVSGPAGSLQFSAADFIVNESNGVATITVTRTNALGGNVTVQFSVTGGSAAAGSDFVATNGTLSFAPSDTSKTFTVTILQDGESELSETVNLTLSNPSGGATLGAVSQAVLTIVDDDPPALSISDERVTEGDSGPTIAAFTVSLSHSISETVTVNFATAASTATAGSDYVSTNGVLTFEPGLTNRTILVAVRGDTLDETDEIFFVNLSAPSNATILRAQGRCIIVDDDGPDISIGNVIVNEGNKFPSNAVFTVRLSAPSPQRVSVSFATADGTATAASDYRRTNGSLIFNPGETNKTIPVVVLGDLLDESNETFFVNLSHAVNAIIADSRGVCTILDNDPLPTIAINDISFLEGNSNTTTAAFTLSLSRASSRNVNVSYYTIDGTATAPGDYATIAGSTTFLTGQTNRTLNINVVGDTTFEDHETFFVNLTNPVNATISKAQGEATIVDDERTPEIISISLRTNGTAVIDCRGIASLVYTLEGTTNFANYADIRTATASPGGTFQLVDTNANKFNFRFYRVRAP